ncbi:phosphatase PAP2 family protein [Pseudorhodoferax sp.]|uniref:phosphatase PAP2 family protein n=1 Tax=Pseudorhodoferax sp. TaxID=1993553 RepID=UPI0039E37141
MPARSPWKAPLALTLLLVAVAVAWDLSGLDLALAQRMGSPAGFALREDWWLRRVLYDGARWLAWALGCALVVGVAWPFGPLRRLPFERRLQLAVSSLLAPAVVALIKSSSHTSCPWGLAEFGGIARYQSHWTGWFVDDGGSGRCFPAGHASAGFAYVAGWFALRRDLPRFARGWLAASLLGGLALGLVQQLRGAHFMSHTLWAACVCAIVGWAMDAAFSAWRGQR